jgi:glutamate/tyrosine decarboxylase-like PLP-dependent enzyme
MHDTDRISAWFAGPKGENAEWFAGWVRRIADDYYAWRRNYYPEDGVVVDSTLRRENEPFADAFEDRLSELLARLKADVPFQSPRYAAHMLAEQTLPSIAGYFAAMLYNPNNVTADVAPVTLRLEIESGRMLCRMIGFPESSWAHLCSGGTLANLESLWVARSVRYLPLVVRDMRRALGLSAPAWGEDDRRALGVSPSAALDAFEATYAQARDGLRVGTPEDADVLRRLRDAYVGSAYNVAERGVAEVVGRLGSAPVLIAPETHHYCFEKALDVLGVGKRGLELVRVDRDFRMRVDHLEQVLDRVEREGRHVLAVVSVMGSTEEGSIDPLDKVVALRAERERRGAPSFWIHADGAYGGYLRSVTIPRRLGLGEPHATARVAGVERTIPLRLPEHGECDALEAMKDADSVTIDPHKLGYIPYPAGAVCFRTDRVKPLVRQVAPYIEDGSIDPEHDRRSESVGVYVLEGSKPGAAAAAVWLSHSLIPLDTSGHGMLMRENIRNACELHALLEGFPAWSGRGGVRCVCLCPPGSNIVCYAFRAEGEQTLEDVNRLNRAIYERFSLGPTTRVHDRARFVSRTSLSVRQYALETVGEFLDRLGVRREEYARSGVFLLRSVLMNPWYALGKRRGRAYLSELVEELYGAAHEVLAEARDGR